MDKIVIYDTETTNSTIWGSIIEVGAVVVDKNLKELGKETQKVNLTKIVNFIKEQRKKKLISTLEKEITFRFLKARKKDGFLNVISIFSFIGISLGVAVLIIVMSVMNGFRTELINKIVGFNAHITVKPYDKSVRYLCHSPNA